MAITVYWVLGIYLNAVAVTVHWAGARHATYISSGLSLLHSPMLNLEMCRQRYRILDPQEK